MKKLSWVSRRPSGIQYRTSRKHAADTKDDVDEATGTFCRLFVKGDNGSSTNVTCNQLKEQASVEPIFK
jgi:hypothetical protein